MYEYTKTDIWNPQFNLNVIKAVFSEALLATMQNEGYLGFNVLYDELAIRPITMLLTSRTKKELDEIFFITHQDTAAPFLLALKINLRFIASSDYMLLNLIKSYTSEMVISLASVTEGVNNDQKNNFNNSNFYMIKNTPVDYDLEKDPCFTDGMGAWYCTMLLLYMFLPLAKETYINSITPV